MLVIHSFQQPTENQMTRINNQTIAYLGISFSDWFSFDDEDSYHSQSLAVWPEGEKKNQVHLRRWCLN
jgi:hypothetical protein